MGRTLLASLAISCFACQPKLSLEKAEAKMSEKQMKDYIQVLASDEFQGRKPFSEGEVKTIDYISNVYSNLGLTPAVENSYLQEVPLVEVSVGVDQSMNFNTNGKEKNIRYKDDFVIFSRRLDDSIEVKNSELVFAGYGIVAPEYGWNDYKNLDVKGKTVLVLVNDPGLDSGDDNLFKGNEMTYYGRWSYKYEEAARQGAAALLIIHDTKGAGYPWSVVLNSALVPKLYQQSKNKYADRAAMEGWLTQDIATEIFVDNKLNLEEAILDAKKKGFKGFALDTKMSMTIRNSYREDKTNNVIGTIKGSDLSDECIVYSAHWDHLGIGRKMNGDSIYNGAVDNGTSLAWMFEIARAFKAMPTPRRSIVFLAPSAEESGLNGSAYYVSHPVFPLNKTVANINNDLMLPYGRMKDLMVTGYGQSELDDYAEEAAKEQGRYILKDPNPHTGMYYRADHFSFAKAGVPALFARGNNDHIEKGKDYMSKKEKDWLANNYHKPFDEYQDWWDLSGVKEDAQLMFRIGWKLANEDTFPKWKAGSEFKAVREKQMAN
ncbi:peptidase M28 [Ancylomarina euxinus]|uniref:Peptidase M28 n=1 Tax=Ancylomarina euxinus TaxID=2283627 RepID=A0A425Y679_9BACT|nr:M28 family peptidase [Ancylomarina euxinus]RRG23819.1 peptidase M28 [Ancylomarina euxinus]